jgi:hypothetical protein
MIKVDAVIERVARAQETAKATVIFTDYGTNSVTW